MTAPIFLDRKEETKEETTTLRTSAYRLLDAIDDNNIEQVETTMSQILKNDVPEVSIRLFYNYAKAKNKIKVCEYFSLVLVATYNTTR
ncbi:MAG: hypothetical protein COB07_04305 [Sulfurovum sp.]|nr:MAG: hypothetical protein COB07_04305 [Sulfurovum sp.]